MNQPLIKKIETFHTQEICLVLVTANDGSQGWGQTAPLNADITAAVLHRQVAPLALGKSVSDIPTLAANCIDANMKYPWSYVSRALCGVETAMWDLQGKIAGKSVCELLGGTPKPLAVYGSSMRRDITPQDEAERLKRLQDDFGFKAFKIRIGKCCGHDQDEWEGRTEAIVPAVRKAVPLAKLLADANSCYTPKKAIEVGKFLQDNGVCHYEEPCPYWELEWTAQVTKALGIDVTGGEQDVDLAQWRRMIAMEAVDVVQPDICYMGGIHRTLQVAAMAKKTGLSCTPHSANRSLVTIFTQHVMCAIPNSGPYLELSIEDSAWAQDFYKPHLVVEDGQIPAPQGPGWGIEIDTDWVLKAKRMVSK